jgi:hypothetical protein
MSASTSVCTTPVFWERLWRSSGNQSVGLFIIAYLIYGYQPQVGASADALVAFYDGDRTRILIAAVFSALRSSTSCGLRRRCGPPWRMRGKTVGARRRPPRAQRSEGCSSCSSRRPQRWRTRSPVPEITRSRRD